MAYISLFSIILIIIGLIFIFNSRPKSLNYFSKKVFSKHSKLIRLVSLLLGCSLMLALVANSVRNIHIIQPDKNDITLKIVEKSSSIPIINENTPIKKGHLFGELLLVECVGNLNTIIAHKSFSLDLQKSKETTVKIDNKTISLLLKINGDALTYHGKYSRLTGLIGGCKYRIESKRPKGFSRSLGSRSASMYLNKPIANHLYHNTSQGFFSLNPMVSTNIWAVWVVAYTSDNQKITEISGENFLTKHEHLFQKNLYADTAYNKHLAGLFNYFRPALLTIFFSTFLIMFYFKRRLLIAPFILSLLLLLTAGVERYELKVKENILQNEEASLEERMVACNQFPISFFYRNSAKRILQKQLDIISTPKKLKQQIRYRRNELY